MPFNLKHYLHQKRTIVEKGLREVFQHQGNCPAILWKSMKYSVFAGGKRLRPILCLAAAEMIGLNKKAAMKIACSLELIHTYSLIHDDLPALDDDHFRRGRRTNHIVFGEAMAILAGDGLQALSFEIISNPLNFNLSLRKNLPKVINELSHQAGFPGMVGGQVDDVLGEKQKPNLSKVLSIHQRKTGALLLSSVRLPALLANLAPSKLKSLTVYGKSAGLAFQIVDDILNEIGNSSHLGKSAGSDRQRGKMTYPTVLGLEASKREVNKLTRQAVNSLSVFGTKGYPLVALAEYMAQRTN